MQLYRGETGQPYWGLCYFASQYLCLDLTLKVDHKYHLSFSFWSCLLSEGLFTLHALFLEHGTKTCSRLPHGILLGITLEATRPSCCTRSLLWPAGQRQRIFKKTGAENKQVLLLLADFLYAAFGTLQTHCRKKRNLGGMWARVDLWPGNSKSFGFGLYCLQ